MGSMNAMPVAAPAGRFRVLVVDDEPNVLSALQRLLRSAAGQRLDAQIVALFVESLQAPAPPVRKRRTVTAAELCVGMHLAEDLLSNDGLVLLAHGQVIDAALIQHFRSHEIRNDQSLKLVVFDPGPTA